MLRYAPDSGYMLSTRGINCKGIRSSSLNMASRLRGDWTHQGKDTVDASTSPKALQINQKKKIQQSEHLWDSPATKSTINKLFINIPQWCELIHTSLLAQKGSQGQGNHFCWWFHPTCVNVKTWTKMNAVLRTRAWKPERNSSSKGPQFHFLREPVFQDSIWHEDIHGQGNFQGNYQKNFTSIEVVKVEEKYQRKCQFEANSLVLWSFFDHCAYSMYSWRINDKTLSLLGD